MQKKVPKNLHNPNKCSTFAPSKIKKVRRTTAKMVVFIMSDAAKV